MLEGQKPKLNVLLIPIPPVKADELDKWYLDCMTTDSVSVFPVPPTDPMPEELMDAYFTNPAPLGFDYSKVPGACDAQ
jgi:ribose transport system substrate-binding protein